MLVGDQHGFEQFLVPIINEAGDRNIQHVVVLGDFGLWDHLQGGHLFLDKINQAAINNKLSVYAIGGNHENWDHWNWYTEHMATSKGFAMVRSRVLLAPKIHHWVWDNKQFVAAGGAVSIDRDERLYDEARGGVKQWWADEQLWEEDVKRIESWNKKAHYLLTHDCSNNTQFKYRLKPDLDSQIHRQRIDAVLRATKPEFHFHGHMHEQYDWVNSVTYGYAHETQTYGLECHNDLYSWGILDTETDIFSWRGENAVQLG